MKETNMTRKKARSAVDITITNHPRPTVDKDPATISKRDSQVAHWKTSPPGQDFLVVFENDNGSPFDEWYFHRGRSTSNIIKVKADPNKTYKYTVFTAGGAHKNDPGIIINP
jgi:hypothetical protein